jgi:hypothetical protein
MVHHRLFAALAFAAVSIHAAPLLTATGYGALRIGMTRGQAERAVGAHILINDLASDDAWVCADGSIKTMPHVDLLLEGLRIKVISISGGPATVDGVRIGTSEAQLRRIFGKRAVFGWRPYIGDTPGAHNVIVKTGRNREFLFQTADGRVQTISAGELPAVEYWEGCV